MWLPLGNQTSCEILGFLHIIGSEGTMIYSANLNIYYYYLIRQNMRHEVFSKKIEPWLHSITILWTIVGGIYVWADKLINPSVYGGCFLAPYPAGCVSSNDDDLGCITGRNRKQVAIIYMAIPCVFAIVISMASLIAIWWKIRSQETRMNRYSMNSVSYRMRSSLDNSLNNRIGDEDGKVRKAWRLVKVWFECRVRQGRREQRVNNSSVFLCRAICYATAFFITFGFPLFGKSVGGLQNNFNMHLNLILMHVCTIVFLLNLDDSKGSFYVVLLTKMLQPLQGLFNILIYTRPHVTALQTTNPGVTWLQAFCRVITSGGDDDLNQDERRSLNRRRSTMIASHNRRSSINTNMSGSLRSTVSVFGSYRRQGSRGDMPNIEIGEELQEVISKSETFHSRNCMNEIRSPTFDDSGKQSFDVTTTEQIRSNIFSNLSTAEGGKNIDVEANTRAIVEGKKNSPQLGEQIFSPIVNVGGGVDHGGDRRRSVRFIFENDDETAIVVSNQSHSSGNDSLELSENE